MTFLKKYKIIENNIEYDVFENHGYKAYSFNGKHHRELGPSQIWADGSFVYNLHGNHHREDGPALCLNFSHSPSKVSYYLNGKRYNDIHSDEEWKSFILMRMFK